MNNNKTGIIIINWNDYNNTSECINSLMTNNNGLFDIIVIDNNSHDDSKLKLIGNYNLKSITPSNFECEKYDIFKDDKNFINNELGNVCISLNDNYGFTGANNFGFKYCFQNNYNKYLLLNNDTVINDINFIDNLINTSNKFPNNLISCKINYFDNPDIIWNLGTYLDKLGIPQGYEHNKIDTNDYEEFKVTKMASCCLLLINKNILLKIGGQDNKYFFNIDDTDYTLFAFNNGFNSIINTKISILHKSAMSVKDKPNTSTYYFYRNLIYFRKKFFTKKENIIPYIYIYFKLFKSLIIALLLHKRSISVYKEIINDILNNNMGKKIFIKN